MIPQAATIAAAPASGASDRTRKSDKNSGVVRHNQIGANMHFDERYIEGRIGKMIGSRAEFYATAAGQSVKDSETGDKPTHGRVGVGLKVGF